MADSVSRLVLDALARAVGQPAGLPLFARSGGLFTATAAGKQAARRCQDDGLLRCTRRVRQGKAILDVCTLTAAGLGYLVAHDPAYQAIRRHLAAWHDGGALGDCPLPALYRRLAADCGGLTIGQFHDRLRLLHQSAVLYLHPWTGPLYELPEPAYALLVGHEIAYYASLRQPPPLAALPGNAAVGSEGFP